jgi:hypothetical protein
MGLDLTFYELKSDNKSKKHEKSKRYIEEVLYLSNSCAMLITNWLYRNDDAKVTGNYLKLCDLYHKIYGYKLNSIYKALEKVITTPAADMKHIYALHYFPCLHSVDDWVSSTEMFSNAYYDDLEYLYDKFDELLNGDGAKYSDERIFYYNISW